MELKIYKEAELNAPEFRAVVAKAKAMWEESCKVHFAEFGDTGSCVLGAGIYCLVVPKGKRKAGKLQIISADSVAQAQGSANWESGRMEVLEFLRANGISCGYEWGYMD